MLFTLRFKTMFDILSLYTIEVTFSCKRMNAFWFVFIISVLNYEMC